MERQENFENQNENLETAKSPFHDVKCSTFAQAETLYQIGVEAFRSIIKGERAEDFIQRIGDVVRFPAWFRVQLH